MSPISKIAAVLPYIRSTLERQFLLKWNIFQVSTSVPQFTIPNTMLGPIVTDHKTE